MSTNTLLLRLDRILLDRFRVLDRWFKAIGTSLGRFRICKDLILEDNLASFILMILRYNKETLIMSKMLITKEFSSWLHRSIFLLTSLIMSYKDLVSLSSNRMFLNNNSLSSHSSKYLILIPINNRLPLNNLRLSPVKDHLLSNSKKLDKM